MRRVVCSVSSSAALPELPEASIDMRNEMLNLSETFPSVVLRAKLRPSVHQDSEIIAKLRGGVKGKTKRFRE